MNKKTIKIKVIDLRRKGKTFSEIKKSLKIDIPKSTLSNWCSDVMLPKKYYDKLKNVIISNTEKSRKIALAVNKIKRKEYIESIANRNKHLENALENKNTAKIALSMLYLGEGGKGKRASVLFGNSDPFIISLFLYLIRHCYNINEKKFRCTLQCRADQNIQRLENFWFKVTKIPPLQFYKARIDLRTLGKPSKKKDCKGVCRIDYLSADLQLELMNIPKILYKGP